MIHFANKELAWLIGRALHLHVALEAEIIVAFREELAVHGAVWVVAGGASLTLRLMLINERSRLLSMAFRALLVHAGHREATRRFHDFVPVRIVALYAIHSPFDHGMMLGQIELGMNFEMARKAGLWLASGIDNEFTAPSAPGNMFAGGTVA